ncbi:hypothetical protein J6590_061369 [Homalodisca vitripennis]|nr:hypothetical protein J6590_061369 [Homalodisca vitripennis]
MGKKLHNFANEDSNLSLHDFRLEVVGALLPEKQQAVPVRPPRNPTHVLSKTNKRDAKGSHIRVRCRVCLEEGRKNSKSIYFCAQCPGEPALCPVGYYEKYHAPKHSFLCCGQSPVSYRHLLTVGGATCPEPELVLYTSSHVIISYEEISDPRKRTSNLD